MPITLASHRLPLAVIAAADENYSDYVIDPAAVAVVVAVAVVAFDDYDYVCWLVHDVLVLEAKPMSHKWLLIVPVN